MTFHTSPAPSRITDVKWLGLLGLSFFTAFCVMAGDEEVSDDPSRYHLNPSVARIANGETVFVWEDSTNGFTGIDIMARRYGTDGQPLDAQAFLVNSYTTGTQLDATVDAGDAGGFVVVWQSGENVATEQGLRGQLFASDGTPQGSEFVVNSQTNGFQVRPSVAVHDDGSFVVAWEATAFDGDGSGIAARRFDASGNGLGPEFAVNTVTLGSQRHPEVAMDAGGDFVVVWGFETVEGRRFNADGTPQSGEFNIAPAHFLNSDRNALSKSDDGSFLVVHTSNSALSVVLGNLFDSTGNAVVSNFEISTDLMFEKANPAVAVDTAGIFQVTWSSYGQDGSGRGVYTQQVGPDGSLIGDETRVNFSVGNHQSRPDVTVLDDEAPTFAWQSFAGMRTGIFTNCLSLGPCLMFADGFESGNFDAWSDASPAPEVFGAQ